MVFFTSDLHFNHDKEFVWGARGFSSVEDMNRGLIDNWNSVVGLNDEVYVLGDFILGDDLQRAEEILNSLNGHICLIIGNHDTRAKRSFYDRFDKVHKPFYARRKVFVDGKVLLLQHYPPESVTERMWTLYGHIHVTKAYTDTMSWQYNVAVDAHNNSPVSAETLIKELNDIERTYCFKNFKEREIYYVKR